MTEWFKDWFGEDYLRLYAHRDDAEAAWVVELIAQAAPWESGARVLDLACGAGRHARHLVQRGARVVGLDLSMPLLRQARSRAAASWVRGDLRALPFADASFALAVNLFTSFGYFADDDQHQSVLGEAARVLERGGRFVLDFFNAHQVRRALVAREESEAGGQKVTIERHITSDGRFIVKTIRLVDRDRRFVERVRLFSPDELRGMLVGAGLAVTATFGNYRGEPLGKNAERAILVGEKV